MNPQDPFGPQIDLVTRCPVHDDPDAGEFERWSCPLECEHFTAELDRRIHDVQVNGNYTRLTKIDGVMCKQQFRNHEPLEEPKPWPR